ncbi:unnamed protein product [Zymoseptoria tritici ST99CH_3D1]|nr:unnamed protein product [Zymoseptoria tritici ST99CH_3D1]
MQTPSLSIPLTPSTLLPYLRNPNSNQEIYQHHPILPPKLDVPISLRVQWGPSRRQKGILYGTEIQKDVESEVENFLHYTTTIKYVDHPLSATTSSAQLPNSRKALRPLDITTTNQHHHTNNTNSVRSKLPPNAEAPTDLPPSLSIKMAPPYAYILTLAPGLVADDVDYVVMKVISILEQAGAVGARDDPRQVAEENRDDTRKTVVGLQDRKSVGGGEEEMDEAGEVGEEGGEEEEGDEEGRQ